MKRLLIYIGVFGLLASPSPAQAQDRAFTVGDGRLAGAPVLPVERRDLRPDEITMLNIHPGYHLTLEFPAPIFRVDVGLQDFFTVSEERTFLFINPVDPSFQETTLSVLLSNPYGDGRTVAVHFLVRNDTAQPPSVFVQFGDPLTEHLNQTENAIAARLSENIDSRVQLLAEERVRERMLFKSGTIPIRQSGHVGPRGERVHFLVDDAEQMPGPDGEERVYIRYRIVNDTPLPLTDAYIGARIRTSHRKWVFLTEHSARPFPYSEDLRSSMTIPPSGTVRGLVIFDGLGLRDNQALDLHFSAFDGRRSLELQRILVGSPR